MVTQQSRLVLNANTHIGFITCCKYIYFILFLKKITILMTNACAAWIFQAIIYHIFLLSSYFPIQAYRILQHYDVQPWSSCKPKVIFSHCRLLVIGMQQSAAAGEMLLSAVLSVHPSHLSSSSFIRGKQQDGRVHLRLIVGLLLLTNPARCWRNKEETKQELGKRKKWKMQLCAERFKGSPSFQRS